METITPPLSKTTKNSAINKLHGTLRSRDYLITPLLQHTVTGLVETVLKSLSVNYVYSAYSVYKNAGINNKQCLSQLHKLEKSGIIEKTKGLIQGYQFVLTNSTKEIVNRIEKELEK